MLTVSAIDDFARRGGMVGLLRRGNEWRFELNPAAARKCGLEFTAGLKRVAAGLVGKEEE